VSGGFGRYQGGWREAMGVRGRQVSGENSWGYVGLYGKDDLG